MKQNDLTFDKLISLKSCFGIIYSGTYQGHKCAIKVLILRSGAHCSKITKKMVKPDGQPINQYQIPKTDFKLQQFYTHRSFSPNSFQRESRNYEELSKQGLTPKFYTSFVQKYDINGTDQMHIGFIVAELMSKDLDDHISTTCLTKLEADQLKQLLLKFQKTYGHRDFKIANMGVKLNKEGGVEKFVILDVDKVVLLDSLSRADAKEQYNKDRRRFINTYRRASRKRRCDCGPIWFDSNYPAK